VTNAISGPGFLLQVGAAAGNNGAFTTVAEVKDISGPAVSLDVIDVTNQDSPGGFEEIIPSIRRAGEVDFDVNFDPASGTHDGATGLLYLAKNKLKRGWRLLLNDPDDSYIYFDGYVVGFSWKAPVAGVLSATTKIRVTGQPIIGTLPS
jgi:hypothetical protein